MPGGSWICCPYRGTRFPATTTLAITRGLAHRTASRETTAAGNDGWTLSAPAAELAAAPPYRFWPAVARDRLTDMVAGKRLALFASGHVHQSRRLAHDGTDHLWVPTTWAVLPDDA